MFPEKPAFRETYTEALATQIRLADDKRTLYSMDLEARKRSGCEIGLSMDTLNKALILPGETEEVESDTDWEVSLNSLNLQISVQIPTTISTLMGPLILTFLPEYFHRGKLY